MSKKVSVDKVLNDIVYLRNQIDGLSLLLTQKKQKVAKYFEFSGKSKISNDDVVVYTQENTKVNYDVHALMDTLPEGLWAQFIETTYEIPDFKKFVSLCKQHGITGKELRPYIHVARSVNNRKLSDLYEKKQLELADIEGCYEATVTKSVAIRLKDTNESIQLT